jgi:hypothetical protein
MAECEGAMPESTIQSDLAPARMRIVRELTLDDARDLLDWLEAHGIVPAEVVIQASGLFAIVWPADGSNSSS